MQVELAALEYRSSRLVRVLNSATGQRMGFGEGGATEVVSARYTCHPITGCHLLVVLPFNPTTQAYITTMTVQPYSTSTLYNHTLQPYSSTAVQYNGIMQYNRTVQPYSEAQLRL